MSGDDAAAANGAVPANGGGAADAPATAAAAATTTPPQTTTPTMPPLNVAYYCTGHGLGHATRSVEVCARLCEKGHRVCVVMAGANDAASLFHGGVADPRLTFRRALLDTGAKQRDPFTVDGRASLEAYHALCVAQRAELEASETRWLREAGVDLVVSDVVPLICAVAARAHIPCVAVSNFSWDFVFSDYLVAPQATRGTSPARRAELRRMVVQIAEDYARAVALLRLPGYVPTPAFSRIEDVPLVVRMARRPRLDVRRELGIPDDCPGVALLLHGGHTVEMRPKSEWLPDGWWCVACNGGRALSPDGAPLPPHWVLAAADVFTPDLVAASDVVVGKIGYGTASECLAHRTPLVFARRELFNEEPFLRRFLERHSCCVEIPRRDFMAGHWRPYVERAAQLRPDYEGRVDGAAVVAERLEGIVREWRAGKFGPGGGGAGGAGDAVGAGDALRGGAAAADARRPPPSMDVRLRDAVVWGYLLQTPRHGESEGAAAAAAAAAALGGGGAGGGRASAANGNSNRNANGNGHGHGPPSGTLTPPLSALDEWYLRDGRVPRLRLSDSGVLLAGMRGSGSGGGGARGGGGGGGGGGHGAAPAAAPAGGQNDNNLEDEDALAAAALRGLLISGGARGALAHGDLLWTLEDEDGGGGGGLLGDDDDAAAVAAADGGNGSARPASSSSAAFSAALAALSRWEVVEAGLGLWEDDEYDGDGDGDGEEEEEEEEEEEDNGRGGRAAQDASAAAIASARPRVGRPMSRSAVACRLPHDTAAFLEHLASLGAGPPRPDELPERRAARGLFRRLPPPGGPLGAAAASSASSSSLLLSANPPIPESSTTTLSPSPLDDLFVARAPGRLDVMGGIADYSGSLALLLPTAEACHVAVQTHARGEQPAWRHMQERWAKAGYARSAEEAEVEAEAAGGGGKATKKKWPPPLALRVVSYHADDTNRAPAFDMDLDDLFDPSTGEPISYDKAREYFRGDPSRAWAAYVAGCLLVLARERGVRFSRGFSVLVASDVPEGKGVSSSAAVEVATMSALLAALRACEAAEGKKEEEGGQGQGGGRGRGGQRSSPSSPSPLDVDGRTLALLCQRVENLVVGAPCGVMDQMASALGRKGELLALLCQPAEPQARVALPQGLRLWALDSGIRHCVGGADYGSVRVGAFMGLALAGDAAAEAAAAAEEGGEEEGERGGAEAAAAAAAAGETASRQQRRQREQEERRQLAAMAPGDGEAAAPFGGYLSNVRPSEFDELLAPRLPEALTGEEFLQQRGGGGAGGGGNGNNTTATAPPPPPAPPLHLDPVTTVEPGSRYAVRVPAAHPVGECFRVNAFRALVEGGRAALERAAREAAAAVAAAGDAAPASCSSSSCKKKPPPAAPAPARPPALMGPLDVLGELMYQSHAAYGAVGLASGGTDRLVRLVREHQRAARAAGKAAALYGAKITGGGCGGAVCVLGLDCAAGARAVAAVARRYARETGHRPLAFCGSSDGAIRFGGLRVRAAAHVGAGAAAAVDDDAAAALLRGAMGGGGTGGC